MIFAGAIVVMVSSGCGSHREARQALHQARRSFTYQGRLIHPALARHFIPYLLDPRDPVIRTVDVTAAGEAANAYSWRRVTIPSAKKKGLADIWYEHEEEGTGPVATPWFGYAFVGTVPGNVQVLRCFDCGGGALTFQNLLFVRFRLDGQDHLLMDVIGVHDIPCRLNDPVILRGERVYVPACRYGEDSWEASEVWLEKTAEGYETRECSPAEAGAIRGSP
jgi:hypothetical protein